MTENDRPAARLPDACIPVLVRAAENALEHSADDGRLRFEPDRFNYLQDMTGIACLAAVLVTEHRDNPLHRDDRLADLIRRAGQFMVKHHLDPEMNPPDHLWYEGREVHEWAFELWLTAYRALTENGAADLAEGWEEGLRAGAEAFHRWCAEIDHVRLARSPNLNISPNHFAFFILNTLESGLLLDIPEYRDFALDRARWLTRQQDPDGYWEETHGPTTSYNYISTGAVGWYYTLTGEDLFRDAVRRAVDFHTRYTYPSGSFLETIDQRVRYRPRSMEGWVWVLQAFSNFPEGRALNEYVAGQFNHFEDLTTSGHRMGRLAKDVLYYRSGDVAPEPAAITRGSFALSLPGGIVKDGAWAVGLCGIPSRSRPHRYTLERQNLLSVWHRETDLIIGGGGSRNQPHAATFHKHVELDPQATVDGITDVEVYTPARGSLDLNERGGTLSVGYWGFDAQLTVELVDDRLLRLTAGAWGRKRLMPVFFSPNIKLEPGVPLVTASGKEITIDGSPFELSAEDMGDWLGQGAWRITVPPGAALTYPLRPYYPIFKPEDLDLDMLYGILTVPISNQTVTLEIRVQ